MEKELNFDEFPKIRDHFRNMPIFIVILLKIICPEPIVLDNFGYFYAGVSHALDFVAHRNLQKSWERREEWGQRRIQSPVQGFLAKVQEQISGPTT